MELVKKNPIIAMLVAAILGYLIGAQMAKAKIEARVAEARGRIKAAAKALGLSEPDVDAALNALAGEGK